MSRPETWTPEQVMRCWDFLRVAAKRFSQTLILITHDMDIAQLADRIVCIEDGKIRKGSDENAEK